MIGYAMVGTSDLDRSVTFHNIILAPLGLVQAELYIPGSGGKIDHQVVQLSPQGLFQHLRERAAGHRRLGQPSDAAKDQLVPVGGPPSVPPVRSDPLQTRLMATHEVPDRMDAAHDDLTSVAELVEMSARLPGVGFKLSHPSIQPVRKRYLAFGRAQKQKRNP